MHYALKRARLILIGILGNPGLNFAYEETLDTWITERQPFTVAAKTTTNVGTFDLWIGDRIPFQQLNRK